MCKELKSAHPFRNKTRVNKTRDQFRKIGTLMFMHKNEGIDLGKGLRLGGRLGDIKG